MDEHTHEWQALTFYVDECLTCGKSESILTEGHYDAKD